MSASTSRSIVEVLDVKKSYGNVQALKGISFSIPRGQVVGFLGPNGAGKSTTMKILTGFISPTGGTTNIAGLTVESNRLEIAKLLGYLPENNPLYEDMMVFDYLKFLADIRGLGDRSIAAIKETVEKCGLGSVVGKDISTLSKGYKQRVGLAQAILHNPSLLILDEPTSGLDPNQIIEIRSLIKELGKEKTILMSTHILSEVQSTCSRVIIINDGQIVADDSPEKLASSESGSVYMEVIPANGGLLDDKIFIENIKTINGIVSVDASRIHRENGYAFTVKYNSDDPRKELFNKVVEQKGVLMEMRRNQHSLEDTFRKLTSNKEVGI